MQCSTSDSKIIIFDTTMRDGELMPGVQMNIHQKMQLAKLLEEMHVDVIEVGYPGAFRKDFDELFMVSKQVKQSIICGLASSQPDEIASVALAIKPAAQGRIHIYTPVKLNHSSKLHQSQTLETIQDSITLARDYCDDVEWSAFDATRADLDFLCVAVESAIQSGASTVSIPDSCGMATPEEFSDLIQNIINRVPNINQATLAVHCHDDIGKAVENSIASIHAGARQIECSINGLGARYGNANLADLITAIQQQNAAQNGKPSHFHINIETSLLEAASNLVEDIVRTDALRTRKSISGSKLKSVETD
jgi:2-isopropylmalate synthase